MTNSSKKSLPKSGSLPCVHLAAIAMIGVKKHLWLELLSLAVSVPLSGSKGSRNIAYCLGGSETGGRFQVQGEACFPGTCTLLFCFSLDRMKGVDSLCWRLLTRFLVYLKPSYFGCKSWCHWDWELANGEPPFSPSGGS